MIEHHCLATFTAYQTYKTIDYIFYEFDDRSGRQIRNTSNQLTHESNLGTIQIYYKIVIHGGSK